MPLGKSGGNDSRIEKKKWRRDLLILKGIRYSYVEHWLALVQVYITFWFGCYWAEELWRKTCCWYYGIVGNGVADAFIIGCEVASLVMGLQYPSGFWENWAQRTRLIHSSAHDFQSHNVRSVVPLWSCTLYSLIFDH